MPTDTQILTPQLLTQTRTWYTQGKPHAEGVPVRQWFTNDGRKLTPVQPKTPST